MRKGRWRRFLPYLDFYLDIGILRLKTDLMHESTYKEEYEYIQLHVDIFRHRLFSIRLYKPSYRYHE